MGIERWMLGWFGMNEEEEEERRERQGEVQE